MNIALPGGLEPGEDATKTIIKLAILAVGGQGGGVLSGWITELAQSNGWHVQSTSVAGVAQRTGATIYYVELMPRDPARPHARPVLALSPAPGDVDILIAAELAEAGRAVLRGFVTPDRTTLIASTHRLLAVSEKIVPGDGRADRGTIERDAKLAAKRFIGFDMEATAKQAGSVVSASLFGALAGSGELPFAREKFEAVIKAGGRGAEASLKAFSAACDRATADATLGIAGTNAPPKRAPSEAAAETIAAEELTLTSSPPPLPPAPSPALLLSARGPRPLQEAFDSLRDRAAALPAPVREMAEPGLAKVVDFLDPAYGAEYLDRLDRALAGDGPAQNFAFSGEAAKYLANAMVYDDIIRVADLKTRKSRAERVRREVGVKPDQTLATTEYFHPRAEELSGLLPARLGAAALQRPRLLQNLNRVVDRGRRVRTSGVLGFGTLWVLAGLRRFRRSLHRHAVEKAHLDEWFALALRERERDYALGVEVLKCRRLIKGYSDTHVRGLSKFDRVLSALPLLRGRADAADWLRRLREAALADAEGKTLDGALQTVRSFAEEKAERVG
ncbi:MAG TPA: indolepyruvate oxidoreductase subunit beta family protein [Mesorhizobium sp.]|jgi:indolepyruvate ferredoxin oxidoreductase beta subunit|nr:indolepyruvate oxidoreductase subunit beta family protein [Mesorhizobium sp.]